MNKPDQSGGGALIAVAIIFLILIVMMIAGGLVFFLTAQRSAQHAALERAMVAERQAVMAEQQALKAALKQREIAEEQQQIAEQARQNAEEERRVAVEERLIAQQALAAQRAVREQAESNNDAVATDPLDVAADDGSATGIDRLNWLVNHWYHKEGAASSEEHWIAPRGGLMLGVNRNVAASGQASFEFLRIEATEEDGLVYHAQPMGQEGTTFSQVELEDQRVSFENPAHDFPRRISYWLDVDRRLHARIEGEVDGQARQHEWVWTAAP